MRKCVCDMEEPRNEEVCQGPGKEHLRRCREWFVRRLLTITSAIPVANDLAGEWGVPLKDGKPVIRQSEATYR